MASLKSPPSFLRLVSPSPRSISSGYRSPIQTHLFTTCSTGHSYKYGSYICSTPQFRTAPLLRYWRNNKNVGLINFCSSRSIWGFVHAKYGTPLSKSLIDRPTLVDIGHNLASRHLDHCPLVNSFHVVNSHCPVPPPDPRPGSQWPSPQVSQPCFPSSRLSYVCQHQNNCSLWGQSNKFSSSSSTSSHPDSAAQCVYKTAANYGDRVAITDVDGDHTYAHLLARSRSLCERLLAALPPRPGSPQQHVALLVPSTAAYVVAQWAVWMAGHVVIPLCPQHPPRLLQYFLQDSSAVAVLCCPTLQHLLPPTPALQAVLLDEEFRQGEADLSNADLQHKSFGLAPASSRAMLLYTSGTTGDPKGVVLTHGCLQSQVQCLLPTWRYSSNDVVLHCLPLHHTHGVVNALMAPLSVGARVVMTSFRPDHIWSLLLGLSASASLRPPGAPVCEEDDALCQPVDRDTSHNINFFHAVPTIYVKLLEYYEKTFAPSPQKSQFVKAVCQESLRLMVCGSAALPLSVLHRWREVTGHTLLERYGMTEIGMALTNPLMKDRKPGFVGTPFPGVCVRIVGEVDVVNGNTGRGQTRILCQGDQYKTVVTPDCESKEGELQISGPNVFKEYWNKPDATQKEFTNDGWFKTGDTAVFTEGAYKILGRTSVDIIKSGGYKVSALGVERVLLEHPSVSDVVVVGAPDATWGQKICAILVWCGPEPPEQQHLKEWLKDRLPAYQVPVAYLTLPELPRNNMGKVNKKQLVQDHFIKETTAV